MWLYTVARNVLLNARRTLARRSKAVQRLVDEMRGHDSTGPSDLESVEIRALIDALPPDDGELLRLIYWDGLASHEAAVVVGINPSTARSRLVTIRARLRGALASPSTPLGGSMPTGRGRPA
jgi:RNA polymerase sigma-70 factor (ECF subfamily)